MAPKHTDLEALIADIGKTGEAQEGVMADLAKGAQDAISLASDAINLLKGKGYPMNKAEEPPMDDDEGDEDGDEEGGEGEEGADEDGDDDSAGYEDLLKGNDGDIDATEFLLQVGNDVTSLRKQVRNLTGGIARLMKGQKEDRELIRDLLGLTAAGVESGAKGTAVLAKGVIALRDAVATIPEPGHGYRGRRPAANDRLRHEVPPTDVVGDGFHLGGSVMSEKVLLAKAISAKIINTNQLRAFKANREFAIEEADTVRIRKQIEELA